MVFTVILANGGRIETLGYQLDTRIASLADGERKFGYSISITGTSDYIFRGISFSNQDPAFRRCGRESRPDVPDGS